MNSSCILSLNRVLLLLLSTTLSTISFHSHQCFEVIGHPFSSPNVYFFGQKCARRSFRCARGVFFMPLPTQLILLNSCRHNPTAKTYHWQGSYVQKSCNEVQVHKLLYSITNSIPDKYQTLEIILSFQFLFILANQHSADTQIYSLKIDRSSSSHRRKICY